jgi:hypothetical protein
MEGLGFAFERRRMEAGKLDKIESKLEEHGQYLSRNQRMRL